LEEKSRKINTCTFFGHRDAPEEIQPKLEKAIIDLIENHNVNKFYVGNNGKFDFLVKKTLEKLKNNYQHIEYFIVLAYHPTEKEDYGYTDYSNTIYFDELNFVPKRLAIYKRNELMVEKSDFLITYVKRSFGGAAIFKELAEKLEKKIINIKN